MESSTPARVLVVAHKTAATPALIEAVRDRARGAAAFTLLVPNPAHGLEAILDSEEPGRDRRGPDRDRPRDPAARGRRRRAGRGPGRRPVADERHPGRDQRPRLRRGDHLDAAGSRLEVDEARPAEQGHRARPAGHDGHRARPRSARRRGASARARRQAPARAGRAAPAPSTRTQLVPRQLVRARTRATSGASGGARAARPCTSRRRRRARRGPRRASRRRRGRAARRRSGAPPCASRRAASSTDSPRSTKPPGNVQSPAPGSKPRRSSQMRPSGARGIAQATGLGL